MQEENISMNIREHIKPGHCQVITVTITIRKQVQLHNIKQISLATWAGMNRVLLQKSMCAQSTYPV